MTKVEDKHDMSIYVCKIQSGLHGSYGMYLVANMDEDVCFVGQTRELKDMKWKYFQTRVFANDNYPQLTPHKYIKRHSPEFDARIVRTEKNTDSCVYIIAAAPNGIKITLFNKPENQYEYGQYGTLNSALETFNTVISIESDNPRQGF